MTLILRKMKMRGKKHRKLLNRNLKRKAKGKSAAEKKADELKEKKKEGLKKRVLLPEDQADGDAGTVVQVER